MAKKALDKSIVEAIIADWRTGAFTQKKLVEKYKVSDGTISKLCKGIDKDLTGIVSAGIAYKTGITEQNDTIMSAIVSVVDTATERLKFLNDLSMKNAKLLGEKLNDATSIVEHKAAQETLNLAMKGASVVPYYPAATTINNNTAVQVNHDAVRDEIIRRVLSRDE